MRDYDRFFATEQIHKFSAEEVGFHRSRAEPICEACAHWFINPSSGWTACEIMSLGKRPVPADGVCRFWNQSKRQYPLLQVL